MYSDCARDEIRIDRLEIYAYHGVYPKERKAGQTFLVSALLHVDTHRAGAEDKVELSTDYGDLSLFIDRWMKEHTYHTLEAAAENLARDILLRYDLICSLELEIGKPEAPIPIPFDCVCVRIKRGWHRAYLSIGSNMGERQKYIDDGVRALREHPLVRRVRVSEIIETKPYGGVEQDDFLNGAIEAETLLEPEELLGVLQQIESRAGRERTLRWGPRTLDLDILFFDKLVYGSGVLAIPHPDMQNREFVLEPLSAIAPYHRHPVLGITVEEMLRRLRQKAQ